MDCRCHERRQRRLDELPSLDGHLERIPDQRLGGGCAETHDNPWVEHGDLSIEPRTARADLAGLRLRMDTALAPWLPFEMFHDVSDVDPLARNPSLLQSILEHTARGPNKRMSR